MWKYGELIDNKVALAPEKKNSNPVLSCTVRKLGNCTTREREGTSHHRVKRRWETRKERSKRDSCRKLDSNECALHSAIATRLAHKACLAQVSKPHLFFNVFFTSESPRVFISNFVKMESRWQSSARGFSQILLQVIQQRRNL